MIPFNSEDCVVLPKDWVTAEVKESKLVVRTNSVAIAIRTRLSIGGDYSFDDEGIIEIKVKCTDARLKAFRKLAPGVNI